MQPFQNPNQALITADATVIVQPQPVVLQAKPVTAITPSAQVVLERQARIQRINDKHRTLRVLTTVLSILAMLASIFAILVTYGPMERMAKYRGDYWPSFCLLIGATFTLFAQISFLVGVSTDKSGCFHLGNFLMPNGMGFISLTPFCASVTGPPQWNILTFVLPLCIGAAAFHVYASSRFINQISKIRRINLGKQI
jgi:hypothetical protein